MEDENFCLQEEINDEELYGEDSNIENDNQESEQEEICEEDEVRYEVDENLEEEIDEQIDEENNEEQNNDGESNKDEDKDKAEAEKSDKEEDKQEDPSLEPFHLRKIFLANLHYATKEKDIKKYFEKYGEIEDAFIMKQGSRFGEKRSSGWGFITFNKSSAVDEVQANRPHKVDDRAIETKRAVKRGQGSSEEAKMQVKMLAVRGIQSDTTEADVRTVFENFGKVISVMIVANDDQSGAVVEYDDCDPVDKACLQDEIEVNGSRVEIRKIRRVDMNKAFSQDSKEDVSADEDMSTDKVKVVFKGRNKDSEIFRKLFVGNVSYSAKEESIKEYFEKFGEVIHAVCMTDPVTKKPRGFAYVTFAESSSVDEVQKNRPHSLDGRELTTRRAKPKDQRNRDQPSTECIKLFVGCHGLGQMTTDELKEVFTRFGEVKTCNIPTNTQGKNRNFAFLEFEDWDAVDKACLHEEQLEIDGRAVTLNKKPKDEDRDRRGGGSRGGQRDFDHRGSYADRPRSRYDDRRGGYDDYDRRYMAMDYYGGGSGYGGGYGGAYGDPRDDYYGDYEQRYGGRPMRNDRLGRDRASPYGSYYGSGGRDW